MLLRLTKLTHARFRAAVTVMLGIVFASLQVAASISLTAIACAQARGRIEDAVVPPEFY